MKLFLTSSFQNTGKKIAEKLIEDGITGKVMFVTTASEGEAGDLSWLNDDRKPLIDAGFKVFDYSVTNKGPEDVKKAFKGVSAVCVAGGNSYYLLDKVRKSGFDQIVTQRVSNNMPYIGSSAGALLAGPTVETSLDDPSIAPELNDYTGLKLCSVSVRPHWGSNYFAEKYRIEFDRLYSLNYSMMLLTDSEYLVVENDHYSLQSV